MCAVEAVCANYPIFYYISRLMVAATAYFTSLLAFPHIYTDSNLVLCEGDNPIWANDMYKNGVAKTVMQSDGNLVSYTNDGKPLWAVDTSGNSGTHAIQQNDGNLVIYVNAKAMWASDTGGH